jgi:hypothetical protein
MDKEPSVVTNWAWAVLGGLVAIAAWRWRWWAGLPLSAVLLFLLYEVHLEIRDPAVGPAIRAEAGTGYATQFYSAVAIAVVLHSVGVYVGVSTWRSRRRLTA